MTPPLLVAETLTQRKRTRKGARANLRPGDWHTSTCHSSARKYHAGGGSCDALRHFVHRN